MDTDQLIRIHSFAFSLRSCQNLAIFAQHYRVKQFNLIVCVELLFFMCAQPQIRLRIAYLRNCLDPKTQLNYFLCVQKRNKNSWYSIPNFFIAYDALRLPFFVYNTGNYRVQINTRHGAKSSILNCKPVQEHSYRCLAVPNIYTITTFISLYDNNGETWAKKPLSAHVRY